MKYESMLLTKASGSVGGSTYSHNRYGAYIRATSNSVNPNSPRQQAVRNNWQTIANAWVNLLTSAQRAAWNLYGASVAMVDKLGNTIYLTGFSHFLRSNSVVLGGSQARVDDGPTNFSLADTDETMVGTVDEASQEISVAFDANKAWVDEDAALMQISMSQPANGSRDFINPIMRIAGYIDGSNSTPPTSPQTLNCPFAVAEGQKVLVTGRILRADGRLSSKFQSTATVTA